MQELQIRFLGWEDPLEKENSNPLQYSSLENPMDRGAWQATVHEVERVGHYLVTKQQQHSQFSSVQSISRVRLFAAS